MASGSSSSARIGLGLGLGSGSRSFDVGSDDVLCSYDEFGGLDASNEKRPGSAGASVKDFFRDTRMGKPSQNVYCQQEGFEKQDMIFLVDKCMQKYSDNLLSVLEGISGHLKQLEVYCYNLEKSIGEFRTDLVHDQNCTDSKFKFLEKHLQEVHRSVQILRDKQELAETQKELTKLQLTQKESSAASDVEKQKKDDTDASNKQLVLALPQQPVAQPPAVAARVPEPQNLQVQQPTYLSQGSGFYPQQSQVLNQPPQLQPAPQHQPPPQPQLTPQSETLYAPQVPRNQDLPAPPQQTHGLGQSQASFPSYPQQQWPQQAPQQYPQPVSQPQQQAPTPAPYPPQGSPYPPYQPPPQPVKASGESFQGSMPMPVSYSSMPPTGANPHEVMPYGYGVPGGSVPQQPPPHGMQRHTQPSTGQTPPGQQPTKGGGYVGPSSYPQHSQAQTYSPYGTDGGGRSGHSQPFYGGGYPPNSIPGPQNQQSLPAPVRGHPFGDLMEKAVSMGYPRDVVAGAIYRMEESGQPADFNALLDMLNGRASVPAQRGWSG